MRKEEYHARLKQENPLKNSAYTLSGLSVKDLRSSPQRKNITNVYPVRPKSNN